MPEYKTLEVITGLETEVNGLIKIFEDLEKLDDAILSKQPAADKWSVIMVLAHLNSYNRYYLEHIEHAVNGAAINGVASKVFRSGWFGNYFTKMMYSSVPDKNEITNKMKSPKEHQPPASLNAREVRNEFLAGEKKLLRLLATARQVNMDKLKVPISISRFIKINLGDTFRFLIAHQVRHFLQIDNVMKAVMH